MKFIAFFLLTYSLVTKAATFMFALFVLTLASVGMYDLVVHPFMKNKRSKHRRVA